MDKKKLIYLIIVLAASLLCLLVYTALGNMSGNMAVISIDGEVYERIDLQGVEEAYDIEISSRFGTNTVHVEPGRISVTHADCPDKVCVRQGSITGPGIPIVCLPNRLAILIEGGELDG